MIRLLNCIYIMELILDSFHSFRFDCMITLDLKKFENQIPILFVGYKSAFDVRVECFSGQMVVNSTKI
jgi:hypothetical protein